MLDLRDHGVDPAVSGGRRQMTRAFIILRRLVVAVAVLNVLVLLMLTIAVLTAADDDAADAKRLGAAVAYLITNYGPDSSTAGLATGVAVDPARAGVLVSVAETVHHSGMWSRGTIEYGHLDGGISTMVVVRQEVGVEGAGEPERVETRTMDVRPVRNDFGEWEFDNPRIDLPDSAIWDICSGHTDHALLQTMTEIAERSPYSVVVLHTGHPRNVFGTPRLSIHAVDSELVIDSHDLTSSTYELSEWLVS
ncbi:MAG: hypothetical protein GY708_11930 [Actinomycetia bacterium]|nr:hypothetical protein [Actinomycetes bacterium]MCP4958977.1 hypothetical protein [Actinomycetes bacterium]